MALKITENCIDTVYVKSYLEVRGLSYQQMVNVSKTKHFPPFTKSSISNVINNKTNALVDTLIKLCECTGLTPNTLLKGDWNDTNTDALILQDLQRSNNKLQEEKQEQKVDLEILIAEKRLLEIEVERLKKLTENKD